MKPTVTGTSASVRGPAAEEPTSRASTRQRLEDALVALGALIALIVLAGRTDFWSDEGFTAAMLRLGWGQLLSNLSRIDINMSVHYILLRGWTAIAGHSEVALRLPSIAAAVSGGVLAVRMVRRLFGDRVASVARFAILLNPFVWLLALTARPYVFVIPLSVLLTGRLAKALEDNSGRNWAIWTALAVLMLYVHLIGVLVIAANAVIALVARRRIDRLMLLAALGLLAGAIPTLVFAVGKNTLSWIHNPTLRGLGQLAVRVAGGHWAGRLVLVAAFVGAMVLIGRRRAQPLAAVTLLAWLVVPLVLMIALLAYQSLFIDKYLVVVIVPLLAMASLGAERVAGRAAPLAMAVVCVAGLVPVARTPTLVQENWRQALGIVDRQVRPADTVAFPNTFYRITAEDYAHAVPPPWWLSTRAALPAVPWGSLGPYELDRIIRLRLESRRARSVPSSPAHPGSGWSGPPIPSSTRPLRFCVNSATSSMSRAVS